MKIIDFKKWYQNLSEKSRIILINSTGAFLIKGLSLVISLLITPAYIEFFNNEILLGVWFTILSVLSWILNFDLGIGNGLRNHLTETQAKKQYDESRKYISSAYVVIGAMCLSFLAIMFPLCTIVDWNALFNIDNSIVPSSTMIIAVIIVIVGIVLQIFLKIISSILYAVHKSSINNAISLATSTLLLLAMLHIPSGANDRNLILMAIIYDLSVLIPYVIATFVFFIDKRNSAIRPKLSAVSKAHSKKVLSLGGFFFLVQILYMLIMSTNEFFINSLAENSNVVEYRIYFQIFTLGSTVFALALTPIWSTITKALVEKDYQWVKKLYNKLLFIGVFGSIAEFLLIPPLQIIFDIWLKENTIQVNPFYALSFSVLGILMIYNSILSSIANGAARLGPQMIVFGSGAILKFPLSYILTLMLDSWIGVVIATDIILFVYCIVQSIMLHQYIKHEIHAQ